jgi:hypothetical protein
MINHVILGKYIFSEKYIQYTNINATSRKFDFRRPMGSYLLNKFCFFFSFFIFFSDFPLSLSFSLSPSYLFTQQDFDYFRPISDLFQTYFKPILDLLLTTKYLIIFNTRRIHISLIIIP